VPPTIAHDTEATIEEARRYCKKLAGKMLDQDSWYDGGLPAVGQVIGNVNVTLLFSLDSYVETAWLIFGLGKAGS